MTGFLVVLNYAVIFLILYFLSRDADKNNIYLSRSTKILFLFTITAPFILIWYFIKRKQSKEKY